MVNIPANPSPWTVEPCNRELCLPCNAKPGTCRGKNVTYRVDCTTCKETGRSASYFGETSRSLADRTLEHSAMLRRKADTSALVKHWEEEHQERQDAPDFSYNLLGRHNSATERQLREALALANTMVDILLNSKTEFARNSVVS